MTTINVQYYKYRRDKKDYPCAYIPPCIVFDIEF